MRTPFAPTPAFRDGLYHDAREVQLGLRRHAHAVMGLWPEFYKLEAWRKAGYTSLEDFRRRFWEAYFLPMDPNNLLCMAWKWRHGDATKETNGDLAAALGRIKAKTLRGSMAHFAMFAIFEEDKKAIDTVLRELLAVPVEVAPEQARAEAGAPAGAKR
jgi:homoserine O-acetyltransferase